MARSSARNRASVAAARAAPKLTGSLQWVAASMLASMSAGRRPEKYRVTSSGVIGIPARANSSAAAAAAICSLSTNTPLQSKMITGASRQRAAAPHWFRAGQRIAAQAIGIVRTWQKSGAARPDDFFTQFPGFATKNGDDRASWPKVAGKKTSLAYP